MGKKELEENQQFLRDAMKKMVNDNVLSNEKLKEKEREIERLENNLENQEND